MALDVAAGGGVVRRGGGGWCVGDGEGPLRSVRQQLLVAVDEARLAIGRAAAAASSTAEGDAADGGGGGDGAAAVEKEVVGHLRALLVEHNEQLGAALLKADLATQEADLARRELAAAAPALERHALERDVCASRLNIVHRQLAERHASGDQWSAKRLRAAEARVEALTAELAVASSDAIVGARRRTELEAEVDTLRAEAAAARARRATAAEAAPRGGAAPIEGGGGGGGEGRVERARVREFLERRVLPQVLQASAIPEQVAAMVREIAAQKLCDERLADRLCASERRHDAQKLQLVGLREALTQAEKDIVQAALCGAGRRGGGGGAAAEAGGGAARSATCTRSCARRRRRRTRRRAARRRRRRRARRRRRVGCARPLSFSAGWRGGKRRSSTPPSAASPPRRTVSPPT